LVGFGIAITGNCGESKNQNAMGQLAMAQTDPHMSYILPKRLNPVSQFVLASFNRYFAFL
jgi:hypothetical protein